MRNFITNFRKILGIYKQFAGNRVNEKGNVARCGVIHSYDMTADNVKTYNILKWGNFRHLLIQSPPAPSIQTLCRPGQSYAAWCGR